MEAKWKISDLGGLLKNTLLAIVKGEFLLRINAGKYLIHIAYTFFLFGMVIWISLMIETTMARVETNRKTIKELEIAYSQKTFEVASLSRRATVEMNLRALNSKLQEPEKPAATLVK